VLNSLWCIFAANLQDIIVYTFDKTLDGLLTAVFYAFALKEQPEQLLAEGDELPLFCDRIYKVVTDEEKARRVWTGLEKRLPKEAMRLISVSWLSELRELNTPLFHYVCKVFRQPAGTSGIERNFADLDVLTVTNIARRVLHEQLRMKQFVRFQKAKDGTYLGVVSPDHNVLPLIIDHFRDRFNDQPWLIYDARRRYGYYYSLTPGLTPNPSPKGEGNFKGEGSNYPADHVSTDEVSTPLSSRRGAGGEAVRITFEDEAAIPFGLSDGKLANDVLSSDDRLLQNLWRTYFKAICIKERMNPRKQLNDMPRRYWKYMTEKQSSGEGD